MTTPLPAASREIDVLCLGAPVVALIETGPDTYRRSVGGDVCLTAIAAARAGARAAVVSRVGADHFGDAVLRALADDGVDSSLVTRDPSAPTGHVFALGDEAGGALPEGSAASRLRPGDLDAAAVAHARVLQVSGELCALSSGARAMADSAMRIARGVDTRVSCSLSLDRKWMDAGEAQQAALALLELADVALIRLDASCAVFDGHSVEAVLDHLLGMGPQVVSLWMGPAGAWVASAQGRWRIEPVAVDAPDSAGAGSIFDGYFLSGLTAGDDLLTAATRANAAAALAALRPGGIDSIPLGAEVVL